ncbi:Melanopsin [Cichlidogyrus casuarinus]|uniref:Melanopsin n=1 Tax=Cichlidogyrus casuarinus TaxID=1844966 RepID=A0ABD2Q2P9_9PLAT
MPSQNTEATSEGVTVTPCTSQTLPALPPAAVKSNVIHDGITPQEIRVIATSIALTISYLVAWTPYAIISFMGLFGYQFLDLPIIAALAPAFAKTSVVSNPALYSLMNMQLREAIFRRLRRSLPENTSRRIGECTISSYQFA